MNRLAVTGAILACLLATTAGAAQVTNKKISGQSFSAELTIKATPQAVWGVLTDVQKLTKALGAEYQGGAKKLEKVGDYAQLKLEGDTGLYLLSYAKTASELRFTWEPDNASYLCQQRWVLTAAGDGTKLTYEERYTESSPQSPEAVAAQVKAQNEILARLQELCGGK